MARLLNRSPRSASKVAMGLRRRGLLVRVRRGEYAVAPLDVDPAGFRPDRYLVVQKALKGPFAFSHQSALSLLGGEQSVHRTVHVTEPGKRSRRTRVGFWTAHVHGTPTAGWGSASLQVRRGRESFLVTTPEPTLVDMASLPRSRQDYE